MDLVPPRSLPTWASLGSSYTTNPKRLTMSQCHSARRNPAHSAQPTVLCTLPHQQSLPKPKPPKRSNNQNRQVARCAQPRASVSQEQLHTFVRAVGQERVCVWHSEVSTSFFILLSDFLPSMACQHIHTMTRQNSLSMGGEGSRLIHHMPYLLSFIFYVSQ